MGDVVAIIPARGGSKGIVRKNLRPLRGVPLVVRAIRSVRAAQLIDRVVVTTDDDEIAAVAVAAGAAVIRRGAELAGDAVPTLPVLVHVVEALQPTPEIIVLAEPTSPFRRPEHVDQCVAKLREGSCGSVVTVVQQERNPFNIFAVDGDRASRFVDQSGATFTSRQQFAHLKRINGALYVTWAANVLAGHLVVDPVRVVEMSPEESVNIDTQLDFKVAELCAEELDQRYEKTE